MHVGLNLVFLVPGETGGMETVAHGLVPALAAERPDLRLTAFVNRDAAEASEGFWHDVVPSVTVPVRVARRVEWVRGEQQLLPRLAARAGCDVVHSLGSTAPGWGRFRRVVTVHDLIYRFYPETHGRVRAMGMRVLVPLAVRRSHRVTTVSGSGRDDLVRHLGADPEKIDVIPNGVDPPRGRAMPEGELRARHDLGHRAVALTVGAKRPHKNLARLLEAAASIPEERRPLLVLAGYGTPEHDRELRERAAALGIERDLRLLGWVSPDELEGLYAAAACVVLPSLYEGFGLPVLEAMARGVPVACSDRSALPEVAGDAAFLFDPEDQRAIAAAIERLLAQPDEAERLREAGLARVREFTWQRAARLMAETYERTLGAASSR